MRAFALCSVLLVGLVALPGCASPEPAARTEPTGQRDVVVDGTSVLGRWEAVGALDEPDVDEDLRRGLLTETLIFDPYGRVTLSGEDRREGAGPVSYYGQIEGRTVSFDELPGRATVEVRSDGRLILTDPRGNRTVYERD
ncbi:MAG: hypothetical protein R3362_04185 [Rhodothermales bacterium]|nr:hypothetical protein [Rhodothermales bacterium]